jgi:hypothetical protein
MAMIFIDVDGVLNAEQGDSNYFREIINGYSLRLNKLHAQWLLDLSEKTGAELAWGTTWQDLANQHIGPKIGLPKLRVATFNDDYRYESFAKWKSEGVVALASGEPFVWFDDEPSIGDYLLAKHSDLNFCFIEVTPMLGLRKKHIDSAHEWLKNLVE